MKRSIFIVVAVLFAAFSARAYAVSDAPDTSAASAIVMHSGGEVIYEKNADAQSLIASTTKLMTAIVAIENCGLDDELEVGADSCGIEGSSMYLHLGQCVTVEDLLYGLLLDRMGLSAKNGWYDEDGRVYIYYTLNEIQADLNCGHEKAVKLLSELDTGKGFGLIERTKQGQGRPTKLYVKRFTTRTIPPKPVPQQDFSRLPKIGSQDFGKTEVKSSENPKSRLLKTGSADFGKSNANYIKSNQPDFRVPSRIMRKIVCRLRLNEVSRQ